jgi:hypothetical protein
MRIILALLIVCGWPAAGLAAATNEWTGTSDWTNTANWSLTHVPATNEVAVIKSGAVTITNSTALAGLMVSNGATLRFAAWGAAITAETITIRNTGRITHATNTDLTAPWTPDAGVFLACSNLTVEGGGLLDVSGAGYKGGEGQYTNGYGPGGGVATTAGDGGGYGGQGQWGLGTVHTGSQVYGSTTNPAAPGSGGGGGPTGAGGSGGGYISIVASGTVTVNGTMAADGIYAPVLSAGGGSGGAILIQCRVLAGTGIVRSVAGGSSTAYSGGGAGGGRIALWITESSGFSGTLAASSAVGYNAYRFPDRRASSAGTIYLNSWNHLPASLTGGGEGVYSAPTGTAASLVVSNYSMFLDGANSNTLSVTDLTVRNAGKIMHLWNTTTNDPWPIDGCILIACSNLTVNGGGQICADNVGFGAKTNIGYGPGGGNLLGTSAGGGGYGGQGEDSLSGGKGGITNGSYTSPATPGSGGACLTNGWGGYGGGYIKINASGTVTIDGTVTANGEDALVLSAGGGSGGGILIQCRVLAGTGTVRAVGGASNWQYSGGGGGGGRIALLVAEPSSFGGILLATAGVGADDYPFPDRRCSGNGTIYLSSWQLLPPELKGGGAARFMANSGGAGDVLVTNYTLLLESGWSSNRLRCGRLTVEKNGTITHMWNTATNDPWDMDGGLYIECSGLVIRSGGQLYATQLGYGGGTNYGQGNGPGHGHFGTTYGSGAGYGGRGGNCGGDVVGGVCGETYGLSNNPVWPGSGGGGGDGAGYVGGHGGGYIKVVSSNEIRVDGTISANGGGGATRGGGGSGGGVYLYCRTICGNGTISANGTDGTIFGGGGGGGGRIAIFYIISNYFGQCTASAAGSYYLGQPGTIYWKSVGRGTVLATW